MKNQQRTVPSKLYHAAEMKLINPNNWVPVFNKAWNVSSSHFMFASVSTWSSCVNTSQLHFIISSISQSQRVVCVLCVVWGYVYYGKWVKFVTLHSNCSVCVGNFSAGNSNDLLTCLHRWRLNSLSYHLIFFGGGGGEVVDRFSVFYSDSAIVDIFC